MGIRITFDVGFSSIKVATLVDGHFKFSKELNVVSNLGSENFDAHNKGEKDIVAFNGSHYIVGKSALQTKNQRIMTITDYPTMREVTPIVVTKYLQDYNPDDVEYLCFTLSSAYLDKSKDFHKHLSESLPEYSGKIKLIPQGAGIKKALDNIGLDVENPSYKDSYKNYLIVDIGFNTIDVANVINGSLIPEDIHGFEHTGAVLIAEEVQKQVMSVYKKELTLDRAKSVLEEKVYKTRSDSYDCTEIVDKAVGIYLEVLRDFLEKNYKDEMDAISNVIIMGGGAEIIRDHKNQWDEYYGDNFMILPISIGSATFYNSLGGLYLNVNK